MIETLKVDDADLKPLKKELFKFWKHFHDDDFFFIGLTVGRHTYREFCDAVNEYNLKGYRLDSFVFLNLKKSFRNFNFDERVGDKEISYALHHLKTITESIKFYPVINKVDTKIQKYFAPIPKRLPFFAMMLWNLKFSKGINATKDISEDFFFKHFQRFMSLELIKESAYNIFNVKRRSVNGKIFIDLESLAEWEEIVIDESRPGGKFADLVTALKNDGSNIDDFLNNLDEGGKKLLECIRDDELQQELANLAKELILF